MQCLGEETTWLNDIRSLLPTAKLQHRGPRPRIPVTVRPLNKRRHANDRSKTIVAVEGSHPGPQVGVIA